MNTIKKYVLILKILSITLACVLFGNLIMKWFGDLFSYFYIMPGSLHIGGIDYSLNSWIEQLSSMSNLQRFAGFAIDSITFAIIAFGIYTFNILLTKFETEDPFSLDIIKLLHKLSRIALLCALYKPLNTILLSVITSLHKGVGNRILTFEASSTDIINIFIVVCLVLITSVIKEGNKLKQDQDLTI